MVFTFYFQVKVFNRSSTSNIIVLNPVFKTQVLVSVYSLEVKKNYRIEFYVKTN